jgi:hypothetical protein
MPQRRPSAQSDADQAAPLSIRISGWLAASLQAPNTAITEHPWIASTAVAFCVAVLALILRGSADAIAALVGILPTCRLVLWVLKKTGGSVPPPPFSQ